MTWIKHLSCWTKTRKEKKHNENATEEHPNRKVHVVYFLHENLASSFFGMKLFSSVTRAFFLFLIGWLCLSRTTNSCEIAWKSNWIRFRCGWADDDHIIRTQPCAKVSIWYAWKIDKVLKHFYFIFCHPLKLASVSRAPYGTFFSLSFLFDRWCCVFVCFRPPSTLFFIPLSLSFSLFCVSFKWPFKMGC